MSIPFKASVSLSSYPVKPTSDDLTEMIFIQRELNPIELYKAIKNGHSICHVFTKQNFMNLNKTIKNFKEAYFIVLDFDDCSLTFDYVLNNAIIKPTIAFEPFSNTENDYRFKMIYLLDRVIQNTNEYKRMTELVFNIAFNQTDKSELIKCLDPSCYTANQMFHGTSKNKRIELFDTVITLELINQIISSKEKVFENYEEVYQFLGIEDDFKPTKKSRSKTKSKSFKKCPKTRNKRIKPHTHYDFSCFPENGTVKNDLFDMGINNEVYFIRSHYNNYHSIQISDEEYDKVYYWVGNQRIYAVNTYFVDGKQKVGYRKKTLQYAAHVFCNLYPGITENQLFNKLKSYAIKFFEQPGDIDNDYLRRLAKSVCAMDQHNEMGRRYFVLNPMYNYLSKSDKMKEIHKRKNEFMRYYILSNHDSSLTLYDLAEKLKLHPKTVKKYLDAEGVCYSVNRKRDRNYQKFLEVYFSEENQKLSLRKLAELCGISKSQVGRYLKI